MKKLSIGELNTLAKRTAQQINSARVAGQIAGLVAYPIPRGGVSAALAVVACLDGMVLTENPAEADFFLDDLIDSGSTMERWCDEHPGKPFFALIDKKSEPEFRDRWGRWLAAHLARHGETEQSVLFDIVRLAADGIWLSDMSGENADPLRRAAIVARLRALTLEGREAE